MSSKPSIYLAGPMSGYRNWNFDAFHFAADLLRRAGYPVINPADFGADPKHSWADCMRRDLPTLMAQDMVVTLPGWQDSRGAELEVHVAKALGMPTKSFLLILEDIQGIKRGVAMKTLANLAVQVTRGEETSPPEEAPAPLPAATATHTPLPPDDDADVAF